MKRVRLCLGLLLLCAVLLSACGGEKPGESETQTTPTLPALEEPSAGETGEGKQVESPAVTLPGIISQEGEELLPAQEENQPQEDGKTEFAEPLPEGQGLAPEGELIQPVEPQLPAGDDTPEDMKPPQVVHEDTSEDLRGG